jgi:hypothetical protein
MLKQRSAQYISLIPDTSTIGNQTIQFITHPETKEIKGKRDPKRKSTRDLLIDTRNLLIEFMTEVRGVFKRNNLK